MFFRSFRSASSYRFKNEVGLRPLAYNKSHRLEFEQSRVQYNFMLYTDTYFSKNVVPILRITNIHGISSSSLSIFPNC